MFRGIIPPMVTPLLDQENLDVDGLERLIEHILSGGVHGLFVLGTTGEGPSLSYKIRQEVITRTCDQVDGRVPVMVGVTDSSFVESIRLAQFSAEAGANAVVVAPPYYFGAGAAELVHYYSSLVKEMPLPVFLYNMPSCCKVELTTDVIEPLLEQPNIVGLKDSSGNMTFLHKMSRLIREKSDWSIFVGPEELLCESLFLGVDGGVSGGANLFPHLYVDIFNAAEKGDYDKARELHKQIIAISSTLWAVGSYGSSFVKGLKCALSCLGICSDTMGMPFERFRDEHREMIRSHLLEYGNLSDDQISHLSKMPK
jgi:4-hydroxy-tetrahydrodipicolinate synthase